MTQERPSEPPAHPSAPALRIYLKHRYLSSWPGFNFLQFFRPFFASPPPPPFAHICVRHNRDPIPKPTPPHNSVSQFLRFQPRAQGFFPRSPAAWGGGVPHWWMPPPPFFFAWGSGDLRGFGVFPAFFFPPQPFFPPLQSWKCPLVAP